MQLIEDPRGSGSTEEIALLYKNCVEARSLPKENFQGDDGRVAAPTKEQWDALPKAEGTFGDSYKKPFPKNPKNPFNPKFSKPQNPNSRARVVFAVSDQAILDEYRSVAAFIRSLCDGGLGAKPPSRDP